MSTNVGKIGPGVGFYGEELPSAIPAVAVALPVDVLTTEPPPQMRKAPVANRKLELAPPKTTATPRSTDYQAVRDQALRTLREGTFDEQMKNPYIVGAMIASDGFLGSLTARADDPERRIAAAINAEVGPTGRAAFRRRMVAWAVDRAAHGDVQALVKPLEAFSFGHGENHRDAVDLFAPEGSQVRSMRAGVVVLAEDGWNGRPLSTSSARGGNTVAIVDSTGKVIRRYCHLRELNVRPGDEVDAGQVIGRVGHTGSNASKPGHGGHLHLEFHEINDLFSVASILVAPLRSTVQNALTPNLKYAAR